MKQKRYQMTNERMIEELARTIRFERGYLLALGIAQVVGAVLSIRIGGTKVAARRPEIAAPMRPKIPATGWS